MERKREMRGRFQKSKLAESEKALKRGRHGNSRRKTSGMLGCEKPVGQSDETRVGKRWGLEGENPVLRMLREKWKSQGKGIEENRGRGRNRKLANRGVKVSVGTAKSKIESWRSSAVSKVSERSRRMSMKKRPSDLPQRVRLRCWPSGHSIQFSIFFVTAPLSGIKNWKLTLKTQSALLHISLVPSLCFIAYCLVCLWNLDHETKVWNPHWLLSSIKYLLSKWHEVGIAKLGIFPRSNVGYYTFSPIKVGIKCFLLEQNFRFLGSTFYHKCTSTFLEINAKWSVQKWPFTSNQWIASFHLSYFTMSFIIHQATAVCFLT